MWHEIRVKKWLYGAMLLKAKLVVSGIFLIFSFSFFFAGESALGAAPEVGEGGVVTVTAVVPLTPEFAYVIRKNSIVSVEKEALVSGETARIETGIRGERGNALRGHRVRLSVMNAHDKEVIALEKETDAEGIVSFSFVVDKTFLGKNIVRMEDVTYGEPILLSETLVLIVYEVGNDTPKAGDMTEPRIVLGRPVSIGDQA